MGSHNPPSPSGPSVLIGTRSPLQSMWDPSLQGPVSLLAHHLVSTPLRDSVSSLAHRPVYGSNIICNGRRPLLADIVLFWVFPFRLPHKVFKTRLLRRGFHTLIKNVSFPSPTDVGSHIAPLSPTHDREVELLLEKPLKQHMSLVSIVTSGRLVNKCCCKLWNRVTLLLQSKIFILQNKQLNHFSKSIFVKQNQSQTKLCQPCQTPITLHNQA